jgi:hypothetical protein
VERRELREEKGWGQWREKDRAQIRRGMKIGSEHSASNSAQEQFSIEK